MNVSVPLCGYFLRSFYQQRDNEFAYQVDHRTLLFPGFLTLQAWQGIGGGHNHHVEIMQQDNQITAITPGVVEIMIARPGRPPQAAVADVGEVTPDSVVILILRVGFV